MAWPKGLLQNLHGLHLMKSAHFLSIFAEAIGKSTEASTALFEELVDQLTGLCPDVYMGMVLMDYKAQMSATKALIRDVFFALAKVSYRYRCTI